MAFVSILVPTRNEEENIDYLLQRIFAVKGLQDIDFEVVFSDGASTDATCDCIRKWQDTHPVRLVESEVNRGLSAAVIAASKTADGDIAVVMDADLSHPPEKIPDLLKPLIVGSHDMVIGSRYVKGGDTPDWPYRRRACSLLATIPARIFTDVKDPLAGFIAVRRERLAGFTRDICGFKFGLELLLTSDHPFAVAEVPITFRDRCYGDSKMSIGVIRDYIHQLLILSGISLRHSLPASLVLLLCASGVFADVVSLKYFMGKGIAPGWAQWLSFIFASAVTGGSVAVIAERKRRVRETKLLFERTLSFFTTVLLVLFLRSAVMGHMARDGAVTLFESVVLAAASAAVCYIGSVFYVFSIGRKRFRGEPVKRFYLVGLVVYMFLFRLVYSGVLPLLAEEKYYLDMVRGLEPSDYLAISSLPALACSVVLQFLPETLFTFRLSSLVIWFLGGVFVFALARDVYNRSVGFRAIILFSVLPFFSATSIHVTRDTALTLFWAASLYWLHRFLALGDVKSWLYASIVLGGCMVFEPLSTVLAVVVLIYILVYGGVPGWLRKRKVWWGFLLMVIVWSAVYILDSTFGSVRDYAGLNWIDAAFGWPVSRNPFAPLFLMTPVGVFAGVLCCIHTGFDDRPIGDVLQYPRVGGNYICTRTLFLLPMISGFCYAVFTGNYLFCSTVVWLAALPCISLSLFTDEELTGAGTVWGKRLKYLWLLMISLMIVTYGLVLHLDTLV